MGTDATPLKEYRPSTTCPKCGTEVWERTAGPGSGRYDNATGKLTWARTIRRQCGCCHYEWDEALKPMTSRPREPYGLIEQCPVCEAKDQQVPNGTLFSTAYCYAAGSGCTHSRHEDVIHRVCSMCGIQVNQTPLDAVPAASDQA